MLNAALCRCQTARIGQDKKHLLRRTKGFFDRLCVPAGINIDAVHRLYPGGVVVQDDDFSLQPGQRILQNRFPDRPMGRKYMQQIGRQFFRLHGNTLLLSDCVYSITDGGVFARRRNPEFGMN